MRGVFTFWPGTDKEVRINNIITDQGEEDALKYLFRGTDWLTDDDFFLGLCGNANVAKTSILANLSDEPTSAGGYARLLLNRDSTDWPIVSQVNGIFRVQSKVIQFEAVGADFSTTFTRAFICNVASGTNGRLFSFSGAIPTAVQLVDGQIFPLQYEFYLH